MKGCVSLSGMASKRVSFFNLPVANVTRIRDTRVIRTRDHTRFVVLGGRPGTDWEQTVSGVRRLCEWALENFHLPANYKDHRRGKYGTFGGGVSFGNGRTEPGGFKMSAHNAAVFQKVLESPEMQRVARYCDRKPFYCLLPFQTNASYHRVTAGILPQSPCSTY